MKHDDHVHLLRGGIPHPGGCWADFGSGTGAFTFALAELIGPQGCIYSVDQDSRALKEQERAMRSRFPDYQVHYLTYDFTRSLDLPELDGMIMANALHFIPPGRQVGVVQQLRNYLQPGGRLILVEYNADQGNRWVPYPVSYRRWETIARQAGFTTTKLLATFPSSFLNEFYSALSCS